MKWRVQRGLVKSTIMGHIERLHQEGENIDLRPHLPSEERTMLIQDTFLRTWGQQNVACKGTAWRRITRMKKYVLCAPYMQQQAMAESIDSKSYDVEEIRQQHPSAYEKWTQEDDNELKRMHDTGLSVSELAERFGRNLGAIRSRLRKLLNDD